MSNILPLVIMLPLMYLLLIRPQKKRVEMQRRLVNSLTEGSEVITASGLYGFVHAVEDDVVWLEISEGVIVRISKQAIGKVTAPAVGADVVDALPAADHAVDDDQATPDPSDHSEKG